MKKQYIQPQASVIVIQNTLLTDASQNYYSGGKSVNFNPSDMEGGNGGDAASRGGYSWDDEW